MAAKDLDRLLYSSMKSEYRRTTNQLSSEDSRFTCTKHNIQQEQAVTKQAKGPSQPISAN